MTSSTRGRKVVIVGGGTAGISVASRLIRGGVNQVTVIDPAQTHYYQPLWTLVGGGRASMAQSGRAEASVMPKKAHWIQQAAETIDPEAQTVATSGGRSVGYDRLIVCPGIQLDWNKIPGMAEGMKTQAVSSNYLAQTAPKTWEMVRNLRSGTAIFTMPAGPIKCAGAPQKIAYLAADYWREQGVLKDIRVVLVLPTPGMFGVKVFAEELERVVARYGIEVRKQSELVELDSDTRTAVIADNASQTKEAISYDLIHVVPPQSAPDWLKATRLAMPESPTGYVDVDKHTMQHVRYPDVFSLGDAGSTPNSKTGASVRKQAPVVAANVMASLDGRAATSSYGGYASCPLTTSRHKMLLAEFDYTMEPKPSIPIINTTRERRDMWYLKRYGLPALYWNLMLKGQA